MKPAVDSLLQIFHLSFEMVWFGNAAKYLEFYFTDIA